jgi:hypothetical protein
VLYRLLTSSRIDNLFVKVEGKTCERNRSNFGMRKEILLCSERGADGTIIAKCFYVLKVNLMFNIEGGGGGGLL